MAGIREEEQQAKAEARDRLLAGDRRIEISRDVQNLIQRQRLGHDHRDPAGRANRELTDFFLGSLEMMAALADQRDEHGATPGFASIRP
jgi:hypothetical protein